MATTEKCHAPLSLQDDITNFTETEGDKSKMQMTTIKVRKRWRKFYLPLHIKVKLFWCLTGQVRVAKDTVSFCSLSFWSKGNLRLLGYSLQPSIFRSTGAPAMWRWWCEHCRHKGPCVYVYTDLCCINQSTWSSLRSVSLLWYKFQCVTRLRLSTVWLRSVWQMGKCERQQDESY